MTQLRGIVAKLVAIVAAFVRKRGWTTIKFCFLFSFITWFVTRNFGSLVAGFLMAVLVTAFAVINMKIFEKASDEFFDVDEADSPKEKSKKTIVTIIKRIFYTAQDYGLAFVSIALVLAVKKMGFSYLVSVVAVWIIIDIPSAAILVAIYEKTGKDMTLGRSYRKAANVIYAHSKIAGGIYFVYEATLASFWSGPDYAVIFFRDELGTRKMMAIALIAITIVHAFLWTAVYWSGYDDIVGLAMRLVK